MTNRANYVIIEKTDAKGESEIKNIIIQCIGFCGTILFFLSFQFRDNKKLFRIQLLSYLFYTTHLLLLGARTGAFSYVLNTVRSFCLGSKNEFLNSRKMCVIICVLQLAAMGLTWAGPVSVIPIAANIASTIAGYTRSGKKIRLAAMFINSPLWIVYDIIEGSWAGILDEVVSEISIIISICRHGLDYSEEKA